MAATALLLTLFSLPELTPLPEERSLRTDTNTAGVFLCIQRAKYTRLQRIIHTIVAGSLFKSNQNTW